MAGCCGCGWVPRTVAGRVIAPQRVLRSTGGRRGWVAVSAAVWGVTGLRVTPLPGRSLLVVLFREDAVEVAADLGEELAGSGGLLRGAGGGDLEGGLVDLAE